MKKYIILSLIFLPFFASADFNRDLYYGLRQDADIQQLQEFLIEQGFLAVSPTGNFFSLTLKAVKNFQTANLISPTGYFGPLTRGKANEILASQGVGTAITNESGTQVSPAITPPKTNEDVVAKLTEQIQLLTSQLAELQKQQTALSSQATTLQTIQQEQQAQTQKLGAIQANTTPPPPPPAPVPIPDVHSFKINNVAFRYQVTKNGIMEYKALVQLTYDTGKSGSQLKRPQGVSVIASSSPLNFTQTALTEQGCCSPENVYANFTIPLTQSGTYPITFSANGAIFIDNIILPVSYIDNWKIVLCKDAGAFCESKDVAWLDMTPRVEKGEFYPPNATSPITDNSIIRRGQGGLIGVLKLKGILWSNNNQFVFYDLPNSNLPAKAESYFNLMPGYNAIQLYVSFPTTAQLGTNTLVVKDIGGFYDVTSGDKIIFSGFPLTFTFTISQ